MARLVIDALVSAKLSTYQLTHTCISISSILYTQPPYLNIHLDNRLRYSISHRIFRTLRRSCSLYKPVGWLLPLSRS